MSEGGRHRLTIAIACCLCASVAASQAPSRDQSRAAGAQPATAAAPALSSPADDGEDEPSIPLLDDGVSNQDDQDEMMARRREDDERRKRDADLRAEEAAGDARRARTAKKPPAEFPYPGAKETAFRPPIPIGADPAPTANPGLPRPTSVTEDGQYIYETSERVEPAPANPALPTPRSTSGTWEYDFGSAGKQTVPANPIPNVERPGEVTSAGYFYQVPKSDESGAWSMRFGIMDPPKISNARNNSTYATIYGDQPQGTLLVDREWRLFRSIGHLGVKIGSGLMMAQGTGQFVDPQIRSKWGAAEERFTFLLFPNTLTLDYRFQYWENQFLIPFVEGGAGYYTFTEMRDDDKGPKFGGAPVTLAAAGGLINLEFLDRAAVRRLDLDYGINHVYLLLEARAVLGLSTAYNFTSTLFNAGVVADF